MKFEEFMVLRGGELVVIDGEYFGQVTSISNYCKGQIMRIARHDGGGIMLKHNAREVDVKYTDRDGRQLTLYLLVYIDYDEREVHNRMTLARLELWKGE